MAMLNYQRVNQIFWLSELAWFFLVARLTLVSLQRHGPIRPVNGSLKSDAPELLVSS